MNHIAHQDHLCLGGIPSARISLSYPLNPEGTDIWTLENRSQTDLMNGGVVRLREAKPQHEDVNEAMTHSRHGEDVKTNSFTVNKAVWKTPCCGRFCSPAKVKPD